MPELPTIRTSETERSVNSDRDSKIEIKALRREGKKRLGSGVDSVVFIDPRNPNKAIAISRPNSELSPQQAQEYYYYHNIFATIFPHNFPHFYGAFGTENAAIDTNHTGTVRERIIEKRTFPFRRKLQPKYPFSEVQKICDRLGIPLIRDSGEHNYVVGRDGGEYYLDMLTVPYAFSLNPFLTHMDKSGYSDKDKAKVEKYIKRLDSLQKEKGPSYIKNAFESEKT